MRNKLSKHTRESVYRKFNYRCAYCGCTNSKLQVDHIVPVAFAHHLDNDYLKQKYVPEFLHHLTSDRINDIDNLIPACRSCNLFKGAQQLEDFRRSLMLQPERAEKTSVNYRMSKRFGLIEETGKEVEFYFERAK